MGGMSYPNLNFIFFSIYRVKVSCGVAKCISRFRELEPGRYVKICQPGSGPDASLPSQMKLLGTELGGTFSRSQSFKYEKYGLLYRECSWLVPARRDEIPSK